MKNIVRFFLVFLMVSPGRCMDVPGPEERVLISRVIVELLSKLSPAARGDRDIFVAFERPPHRVNLPEDLFRELNKTFGVLPYTDSIPLGPENGVVQNKTTHKVGILLWCSDISFEGQKTATVMGGILMEADASQVFIFRLMKKGGDWKIVGVRQHSES